MARRTTFGPLVIAYDDSVLEPRQWTIAQAEAAVALAAEVPPGPILELYAGVGHIGLVACVRSGRALVQVEADETAARYARRNAAAAGVADLVDVRWTPIDRALAPGERYPLVVADPPYLPRDDVEGFPGDPAHAVDGGDDGLDEVRRCLAVVDDHLAADGAALLQVRDGEQADAVAGILRAGGGELRVEGAARVGDDGAIVLLGYGSTTRSSRWMTSCGYPSGRSPVRRPATSFSAPAP